jgi:hypothetical protein
LTAQRQEMIDALDEASAQMDSVFGLLDALVLDENTLHAWLSALSINIAYARQLAKTIDTPACQ